jgi:hypothetical protein
VTIHGFYSHVAKISAAEKQLGWLPLVYEGAFQADAFDADAFDKDIEITFDARLAALYVDWRDGTWKTGLLVDDQVLLDSITRLERAMLDATIRWSRLDDRGDSTLEEA